MAKMVKGKKVRLGIIGTGGMGQGHCRTVQGIEEVQLTAICDIDKKTAQKVGGEYNVPYFLDYQGLIKSKLCDAVIVATPHPVRVPAVLDCMKAGLHLLSEKPLTECISTADQVVATAKQTGVGFAVMFQRRAEPAVLKAMELIRGGKIGKILRTTLISPEYRSQAYYDSGTWRATWSGEGGGVMLNQSPHVIDLFIQMAGMPCRIQGRVQTSLHHIEVEDFADALLTYPDGGTGYFYASTNEAGPGQMIEIFGDKGKLVWRNGVLEFFEFKPGIDEFTRTSTAMWGGPQCKKKELEIKPGPTGHGVVIRNFARHLLYGTKLISPGHEGLQSLEFANAVWLSSEKGKALDLPISRKAYETFLAKKRRESTFVKTVKSVKRVTDPRTKA